MIRNGRPRPETPAGLTGVIQASFINEVSRFGQNSFCRDSFNGTRPHFVPAKDGLSYPQRPYGLVVDRIKAFNETVCKQCPSITQKCEHFFGKFFDGNGHVGKNTTSLTRSLQLSQTASAFVCWSFSGCGPLKLTAVHTVLTCTIRKPLRRVKNLCAFTHFPFGATPIFTMTRSGPHWPGAKPSQLG